MDDSQFGSAVPAFKGLRIQSNSLGAFDFRNGKNGLYGLKGTSALVGTALDDAIFGTLLLPRQGAPRSVDLWPIFHTGVPNLAPYQLASVKNGNPLANGKPFINNFLPNGGDMLRLNMAVPPTPRNDPVGGVVLAAIGLWYDDYFPGSSASPVSNLLVNVLQYSTGVEANDADFTGAFPYLAEPWRGTETGAPIE